jgi:hypothetical protein
MHASLLPRPPTISDPATGTPALPTGRDSIAAAWLLWANVGAGRGATATAVRASKTSEEARETGAGGWIGSLGLGRLAKQRRPPDDLAGFLEHGSALEGLLQSLADGERAVAAHHNDGLLR